jgi:hypothetical protein
MHLTGSGVITPSVGAHSTLSGTAVTLHARPAAGWQFDGWRGAVTGTLTQTQVMMDADKSVTATFVLSSTANTPPTLSPIADQSTFIGVPVGPLDFTIGDAETAAADLTLAGASSNVALVPVENIVFNGNGAERAVTITPVAGRRGTATLTITVSDGELAASECFVITVTPYQVYLPLVQRE